MTPEKSLAFLLGVLLVLIIIMVITGAKRHMDERRWNNRRVRWDYAVDGRIVLVDVKGNFVAISRSPQDRDIQRLRRIAHHLGYVTPRYSAEPLDLNTRTGGDAAH